MPAPYILIVDDQPMVRDTVQQLFQGALPRAVVDTCSELPAPSAWPNLDCYDLIVLDLNMPQADGLVLMRHLAEAAFQGRLCIMSGEDERILASARHLAESLSLRLVAVVSKPMKLADARKLVEDTLRDKRQGLGTTPTEQKALTAASLRACQVEVHYQPKVAATSSRFLGSEALMRLRHPDKSLLLPSSFLVLAEAEGLLSSFTETLVRIVLKDQMSWAKAGHQVAVSVNLSAALVDDLELPDALLSKVCSDGMGPGYLGLEVTERDVTLHEARAAEVLSRLRLKGFALSIDDYGTGYSSLQRLYTAPFSELKIDRSFVQGATEDRIKRSIAENCVHLAKSMGLSTVAEGVETEKEWNLVSEIGVDAVQGYYVARPMPADQFATWLTSWPQ